MKHFPVDVNVHVRKDVVCRIKFEKFAHFIPHPESSQIAVHMSILMALRS